MLAYFLACLCAPSDHDDSNYELEARSEVSADHYKDSIGSVTDDSNGTYGTTTFRPRSKSCGHTSFLDRLLRKQNRNSYTELCDSENHVRNEVAKCAGLDCQKKLNQKVMSRWWDSFTKVSAEASDFEHCLNGQALRSNGLKLKRIVLDTEKNTPVVEINLTINKDMLTGQMYSVYEVSNNIDPIASNENNSSYLNHYKTDERERIIPTLTRRLSLNRKHRVRKNTIKSEIAIPEEGAIEEAVKYRERLNKNLEIPEYFFAQSANTGRIREKDTIRKRCGSFLHSASSLSAGRIDQSYRTGTTNIRAQARAFYDRIDMEKKRKLKIYPGHSVELYRMQMKLNIKEIQSLHTSDLIQLLGLSEKTEQPIARNTTFFLDLILFLVKYDNIGCKVGYSTYSATIKKKFKKELQNKIFMCRNHCDWQLLRLMEQLYTLKRKCSAFLNNDIELKLEQSIEYHDTRRTNLDLETFKLHMCELLKKITNIFSSLDLTFRDMFNNLDHLQHLIDNSILDIQDRMFVRTPFESTIAELSDIAGKTDDALTRILRENMQNVPVREPVRISAPKFRSNSARNSLLQDNDCAEPFSEPFKINRTEFAKNMTDLLHLKPEEEKGFMLHYEKDFQDILGETYEIGNEMIRLSAYAFLSASFLEHVACRFANILSG